MEIILTMYNLRRAMSILGVTELKRRLTEWKATYKAQQSPVLSLFAAPQYVPMKIAA